MTTEDIMSKLDRLETFFNEELDESKKKKKKPYNSISITTGDIDYNIRQFNKRMGTDFPGNDNNNPSTVEAQAAAKVANAESMGEGSANNSGNSGEAAGGEGMGESILHESSLVLNRVEFETEDGRKELEFRWDKGDTYRVSLLSIKNGEGREDWSKVYYDKDTAERRYNKEVAKAKKNYTLENEYAHKSLTEAKREVTRYYIRPQNIFCSNKADVLKALIELDDQNCSVYTLKNLKDNKDVHKLTTNDIIYYYDDGILYDKNKVKVMDYDLYIKHEEERKKFAGNAEQIPDAAFTKEYKDRMTDKTIVEAIDNAYEAVYDVVTKDGELIGDPFDNLDDAIKFAEENNAARIEKVNFKEYAETEFPEVVWENSFAQTEGNEPYNPFNLTFESFNAFGERIVEGKEVEDTCCICGEPLEGYGNNPAPYKEEGRCCSACNIKFVIPARLAQMNGG